jgi:hypothetical protein
VVEPKVGKYYYIYHYPQTEKKCKEGILVKVTDFESKEGWQGIYGDKVVVVEVIKKSPSILFRNWNRMSRFRIDSANFSHAIECKQEELMAVLI